MDWKRFDRVRGTVGPVHLDLVESYAAGRINRRDFMRRGALVGLSLPMIGAVIAAVGAEQVAADSPRARRPAATQGGTIRIGSQRPRALDPIQMQDLGAYGIIAQSFEFLVTLGDDGGIAAGLAESWEPNETGDVWTFQLRQGVKWHDGTDFTSADVAATMDRLVEAANSGLDGVIEAGAVDASDPAVAVFTLLAPNGNLPALVSCFNAQTAITPANYETGTTLDAVKAGTGAWILDSFDPATGCTFVRNENWWGGTTPLDSVEYTFFEDLGTMLTAQTGGAVDGLVQFSVIGGDALLNDPNFTVLEIESATHRQIWMRCDTGQFADVRVRQALAYTFNRDQMLDTLFRGRASKGNDHVIPSFFPYFDDSVPQRDQDIEMARQLLSDAGVSDLRATLQIPNLQEIPDLAQLIVAGASQAGITIEIAQESTDTFYSGQWCPPEPAEPACSGAAELGIVDYGDRPTPDIYCNSALRTGGVWNSSQYANPDFDAAFAEFQGSVTVEAQTAACRKIETILNEDVPVGLPFFYNFLSGHSSSFQGVQVTAIGQMFLQKASQA